MTGFEPATLASQMQCATKLRYIPIIEIIIPTYRKIQKMLLYIIKSYINKLRKIYMKNLATYLSTAPVIAGLWLILSASLLIEINRFFPDALTL